MSHVLARLIAIAAICALTAGCSGGAGTTAPLAVEPARPGDPGDSTDGGWPAAYEGSTIPYSGDDPLMTMLERGRERVVRALSDLTEGTLFPPICGGTLPTDPLRTLVPSSPTEGALCRSAIELLAKEILTLNQPGAKTPFKIQEAPFPNGIIAMTKRTRGGEIRFHKASLERLLNDPRRVDAVIAHEFGHKPNLLGKLGIAPGALEERVLDGLAAATVLYHDGLDKRLLAFSKDTLVLASDEGAYHAAFGDTNGSGKSNLVLAQGEITTVLSLEGKALHRISGPSRVVTTARLRSSKAIDFGASGGGGMRLYNGELGTLLSNFPSTIIGLAPIDRDDDGIDDIIASLATPSQTRLHTLSNGNGAKLAAGGFRHVFTLDIDGNGTNEIVLSGLLSAAGPATRILDGRGDTVVDKWDYDLVRLHLIAGLGLGASFSDGKASFVAWNEVPVRTVAAILERLGKNVVSSKVGSPSLLIPVDFDGDDKVDLVHVLENRVVVTNLDASTPKYEFRYRAENAFVTDFDKDGRTDLVLTNRPALALPIDGYTKASEPQSEWACLGMNRPDFAWSVASSFDPAFVKRIPLGAFRPASAAGHRLQILMSKEMRLSGATLAAHLVGRSTGRYLSVPGGGVEGNGVRVPCLEGPGGKCHQEQFAVPSNSDQSQWHLPPETFWGLTQDPEGYDLVLQWEYSYPVGSAFELSDASGRAARSWNAFFVRLSSAAAELPSIEAGYAACDADAKAQAAAAEARSKRVRVLNQSAGLQNVGCNIGANQSKVAFGTVAFANGATSWGVSDTNGVRLVTLNGSPISGPSGYVNFTALLLSEYACNVEGPNRSLIVSGSCGNPFCMYY